MRKKWRYLSLAAALLPAAGCSGGHSDDAKGEYHAWSNVWTEQSGWMDSVIYFDGGVRKLTDLTFASNDKQSKSIMEYIGNTANCKERFVC